MQNLSHGFRNLKSVLIYLLCKHDTLMTLGQYHSLLEKKTSFKETCINMQLSVHHEQQHRTDTPSGNFCDSKAALSVIVKQVYSGMLLTHVARPGPASGKSIAGVGNSSGLSFSVKRSGKNYQYSLFSYLFDINCKLILT